MCSLLWPMIVSPNGLSIPSRQVETCWVRREEVLVETFRVGKDETGWKLSVSYQRWKWVEINWGPGRTGLYGKEIGNFGKTDEEVKRCWRVRSGVLKHVETICGSKNCYIRAMERSLVVLLVVRMFRMFKVHTLILKLLYLVQVWRGKSKQEKFIKARLFFRNFSDLFRVPKFWRIFSQIFVSSEIFFELQNIARILSCKIFF